MGLRRVSGAARFFPARMVAARPARGAACGAGGRWRAPSRRKRSTARSSRPISTVPTSTPRTPLSRRRTKTSRRRTPAICRPSRRRPMSASQRAQANRILPREGGGSTGDGNVQSYYPRGYGVTLDPERLQRQSDDQHDPSGRIAGLPGARAIARDRTEHASFSASAPIWTCCGTRPFWTSTRITSRSLRSSSRDPRPLQGRRSDPHRRGASRGDPGAGPGTALSGRSDPPVRDRPLPSGDRRAAANLAPVRPLERPLPKTLPDAVPISQPEHPAIIGALHGVDAAELR